MGKGQETKQQILATALKIATQSSLDNLTIGGLAVATGMSKSGLFSHFKSKETLQLNVLEFANALFQSIVIKPIDRELDPLNQLLSLCKNWLGWYEEQAKTCIFISAAVEFDDQPGAIHDQVKQDLANWLSYLTHKVDLVIKSGQFKADVNAEQFVFELYALYLGSQSMSWLGVEDENHSRFNHAFNQLIERHRA
ncbi:TetR/AcrR family transcriptional regulator [Pseudoalteromonas sp.]|uniref:TetR/AcrR family transcriptional regulator n=1 Tax=Pseudoalteromonas sp. TaxID=53249 RepID=UPI003569A29E